jgi:hypothetical protein
VKIKIFYDMISNKFATSILIMYLKMEKAGLSEILIPMYSVPQRRLILFSICFRYVRTYLCKTDSSTSHASIPLEHSLSILPSHM